MRGNSIIQGHGASNPIAFFISDGAQSEDVKTNFALSGYQESVLREFCKESGLSYQQFWKTALIKEPVEKADDWSSDYLKANEVKVNTFSPILIDEIKTLRPNLLIPLGELSFNFVTKLTGVRKFRGSVLPANCGLDMPTKVLPILGPYPYLNSEYRLRYISRIDFQKIEKNLKPGPPPDDYYKVWIAQNSGSLRTFIDRSYPTAKFLVFDIETFMQIPTCISFCFDGFESVCVPLLDKSIDFDNRVLMMDQVARLLASEIPKVNQNIKYDWKILERWGFYVKNVCGDTMLGASTLYCEFPKNLGFLTSIYTDLPYFKDEGREYDPTKHHKDQFYLYNAKDSLSTHQISTKQAAEIDEQGVRFVYDNLVRLIPIYKQMEDNGIRVDDEQRCKLLAKYESMYRIHCIKLNTFLNETVNPLSSQQMNRVIFEKLRYKKLRNANNTEEDSLMLLRVLSEAAAAPSTGPLVIDEIIACRKIHKVIEILNLALYPDNRFRCEFNLAGTETGRSSAGKTTDQYIYIDEKGKTKVGNLGHSLQTIGKHGFAIDGVTYGQDIRSMYVPSRGFSFVENDLKGAEARVDAILSDNFDILPVFDSPTGIHRLTGSWIYACTPEEIKKGILVDGIDRYHVAKQVRHSGERNITAEGLITKFLWGTSLKEGKRLLDEFHKHEPKIRSVFHRSVIECIDATRCLIAPNGRRRDFFDRIDRGTYNEGFSFLPQAIVSDQTKFSLIKTTEETPWARLLVEAHDGVLSETPIGRELEFSEIYKRNIEKPIDFRKCSLSRDYELTIPCETSAGESWYGMEEIEI